MSLERRVRDHFQADARRFDAIYDEKKSPLHRFIDCVWRGVVRRRFELTLDRLRPLEGKSVLDIGCGSGRYCLAYAQRGAARVMGVDFAPAMIDLSRKYAREVGVDDVCEFRAGAFPDCVQDGSFDYSTAMGFFDYVERPVPLMARMRELTRERMMMSFPKASEWRAPLRRLRFRLLRCPLFLYSETQVQNLLAEAGIGSYEWISLDRDFVVCASLSAGLTGPSTLNTQHSTLHPQP